MTLVKLLLQKMTTAGVRNRIKAGLVLTGDTALLPNVVKLAEQVFDMPVRIGYPSNVGGLLEQINTPRTTTAVGLVLFGSHSKKFAAQEQGGIFSRFKRWLRGMI